MISFSMQFIILKFWFFIEFTQLVEPENPNLKKVPWTTSLKTIAGRITQEELEELEKIELAQMDYDAKMKIYKIKKSVINELQVYGFGSDEDTIKQYEADTINSLNGIEQLEGNF